jgi:hypothetical protein
LNRKPIKVSVVDEDNNNADDDDQANDNAKIQNSQFIQCRQCKKRTCSHEGGIGTQHLMIVNGQRHIIDFPECGGEGERAIIDLGVDEQIDAHHLDNIVLASKIACPCCDKLFNVPSENKEIEECINSHLLEQRAAIENSIVGGASRNAVGNVLRLRFALEGQEFLIGDEQ